MCDRVIWLHDGQIAGDGDPDEVVEAYRAVAHEQAQREYARRFALLEADDGSDSGVTVERLVATTTPGGAAVHLFRLDEPFAVEALVSSDRCARRGPSPASTSSAATASSSSATRSRFHLAEGKTPLVISLGSMRLGRFTYRAAPRARARGRQRPRARARPLSRSKTTCTRTTRPTTRTSSGRSRASHAAAAPGAPAPDPAQAGAPAPLRRLGGRRLLVGDQPARAGRGLRHPRHVHPQGEHPAPPRAASSTTRSSCSPECVPGSRSRTG